MIAREQAGVPLQRRPTGLPMAAGLVRLARLSNAAPAAALVLLGGYLAAGSPLSRDTWLAACAMACTAAFGYVSNDLHDIPEDRVNKPDRPLPSGVVSIPMARLLAAILAVTAMALSAFIGLHALAAASLVIALLLGYNARLKSVPVMGNATVAVLAASTLVVGSVAELGLTAAALTPVWAPALVLGMFIATREMLKTIEDMDGDRIAGRRTLATASGYDRAATWVSIAAVVTVAASLLAFAVMNYSAAYLIIMLAGVDTPLLFTVACLQRERLPTRISHCLAILKGSYFAGLAALLLA